ncbi:phosphatidylinositol-binding protein scs2 [Steccherinum ochraceum]|uniref:Phosphatidylinositol-binding protein scs2 n=1 Tax=Steccherinum ochraceum TaxID=92696 RepID=A0A4R0R4Z7_9APHY|nr:phosphatidylinositol-binding protein scs2 [Steccherinum ochraceum]
MSVVINPSSSLGFNRPLTQHVKRALNISNNNPHPVAFKVKTTAPKGAWNQERPSKYKAMKEEPPMNTKCKDKFLIQSTTITPEKETLPLQEMWAGESSEEIHSQKIRVVYLPPEGQTVPEEDESNANMSSMMMGDSRFETVRHIPPPSNGHIDTGAPAGQEEQLEPEIHVDAPSTPPADDSLQEQQLARDAAPLVHVNVHQPQPPTPQPAQPAAAPAPDHSHEIAVKDKELREAMAEIERLRSLISSMPEPSTAPPSDFTATTDFRRRRPRSVLSDDDDGTSTLSPTTEYGSFVDDRMPPPEGVPLQAVIAIAVGIFVMTYLFF